MLANLALGVPRRKTGELQLACDGRFTGAHAQMCRLHPDASDHLAAKIAGWTSWPLPPPPRSRPSSPG